MGRKRKSKTGKIILLAFCCILLSLFITSAVIAYNIYLEVSGDNIENKTVFIEINTGDSTSVIADKLKENGVIKFPAIFTFLAKQSGFDRYMQIGIFELNIGDSYQNLYKIMQQIQNYRESVRITFPEGLEVNDFIKLLVQNGVGNEENYRTILNGFDFGYDYIPKAGTENRMEGFLFPDTYDFFINETEEVIIKKLVDTFDSKINSIGFKENAEKIGMTFGDALILASIIEMEGQVNTELSVISSVFHNRIKIKMKLQSCATVNYILPAEERRWILTYAQMNIDNPYNTYVYDGLTPTPISCPGLNSLRAAVEPDDTDYLYFCAKGDGSHAFAKTYEEHDANAKKYLGS